MTNKIYHECTDCGVIEYTDAVNLVWLDNHKNHEFVIALVKNFEDLP